MALVGGLLPPVLGLLEVLLRLADEVAAAELELDFQITTVGLMTKLILLGLGEGPVSYTHLTLPTKA